MKSLISFFIARDDNKIIFARQFTELSKYKLFELGNIFYKNYSNNKHTNFFDNKKYRFVYILNNNLFFVLVTYTEFSIFQSLDITKAINRQITEQINMISEDNIKQRAFDITFAIDDIANKLGIDDTNHANMQQSLKMESFDERDHIKDMRQKEQRAMDNIVKGVAEIEKLKSLNLYNDTSVSEASMEREASEAKEAERVGALIEQHRLGMQLRDQFILRAMLRRQEDVQLSKII